MLYGICTRTRKNSVNTFSVKIKIEYIPLINVRYDIILLIIILYLYLGDHKYER